MFQAVVVICWIATCAEPFELPSPETHVSAADCHAEMARNWPQLRETLDATTRPVDRVIFECRPI